MSYEEEAETLLPSDALDHVEHLARLARSLHEKRIGQADGDGDGVPFLSDGGDIADGDS